jgi:hypothetical protein
LGWVGVENYCDFFWVGLKIIVISFGLKILCGVCFFFLPEWLKSGFVRPATSSSSFFFPFSPSCLQQIAEGGV